MPCHGILVHVDLFAASSATTGLRLCSILSISGSQMQKPCSALQPILFLKWLQLWVMRTLCISAGCSKNRQGFRLLNSGTPTQSSPNKTCPAFLCLKIKQEPEGLPFVINTNLKFLFPSFEYSLISTSELIRGMIIYPCALFSEEPLPLPEIHSRRSRQYLL